MNVLIKSATIVDENSVFNGKKVDILIERGIIKKIAPSIKNTAKTTEIKTSDLHVSIGWFDLRANFCDPGFEYKEDLKSGLKAASKGGFTGVLVMPTTHPTIDSKSGVEYILNKTKNNIVSVYPAGALTVKCEGNDMSEMYDMHLAGAVAFTDNKKSIKNPGILTRAMLYNQSFNGLVMNFPNDDYLYNNGQINEGVMSTRLGLKGIPAIAEELMVIRDLFLAEYCNSKIHLTNISTKKSVQLIKEAKAKGIKVTADTNSYHLLLDETLLENFDSNLKLLPPLRTKEDIKALIKGLKEGTIDAVCSDHTPQDIESKQCEFDHAKFGMINLQSSFSVLNTALKSKLSLNEIITLISSKPRDILNLETPKIEVGTQANLTLFCPNTSIVYETKDLDSKSKNSAILGKKLIGKVIGIINQNKLELN